MKPFLAFIWIFTAIVCTNAQTTVELQPHANDGKDAKINSLNLWDPGTSKEFIASSWTFGGIPGDVRSFIEFDLSFIPEDANVITATLYLYSADSLPSGNHSDLSGTNEGWIEKVVEEWSEETINWNNQPATTAVNRIAVPASHDPMENYEINVSQMVQEMVANPEMNNGFMFKMQTEEYYRRLNFASSDYPDSTVHPKLAITYASPDLLLYYPIEGNANDLSGNDFHGVPLGCFLVEDKCGNPFSAYGFDGSDDFIELPNNSMLKPQFPISITCWINIDEYPESSNRGIFTNDFLENYYTGVWIGCLQSEKIGIGFGNGGAVNPINRKSKLTTQEIAEDEWFHLTAVFESAEEMRIYINATEDPGIYEGGNTDSLIVYSDSAGRVGAKDFDEITGYFNGKLDEITYWNKALNQGDIDSIYDARLYLATADFSYTDNELSVEFENLSNQADTYLWDFGDGNYSTETNPVHTYEYVGNYPVTLAASNSCSPTDTITKLIKLCVPPDPSFTPNISGFDVYFVNNTDTALHYFWEFGDGKTSSEKNPIHTYDSTGFYNVCLQASNDCGNNTYCDSILIAPLPLSNFGFEIDNGQVIFNNQSSDFISCLWDFGDGTYSTDPNPTHTYDSAGTYNVCLTIEMEHGFYVQCDNLVIESETGISESFVFPNPSNGHIQVHLEEHASANITIFSLKGELLYNELLKGPNPSVNLSMLPEGIHIMEITNGKTIDRIKFIKE